MGTILEFARRSFRSYNEYRYVLVATRHNSLNIIMGVFLHHFHVPYVQECSTNEHNNQWRTDSKVKPNTRVRPDISTMSARERSHR